MPNTDVSHVLSMLSAICQSPQVFIHKPADSSPTFFDGFDDNELTKILKTLSFSQICSQLGTQIASSNGAQAQNESAKHQDTGIYELFIVNNEVNSQVNSQVNSEVSNETSTEANTQLSNINKRFRLYVCPVSAASNEQLATRQSSIIPDIVLGACVGNDAPWNASIKNGVFGLASMLKNQMQQAKALAAVKQSEALFKEISSLNKDYIYIKNANGKVIFANRAIQKLFDKSSYAEVLQSKLQQLFENKSAQPIDEINDIVKRDGEHQREDNITLENGTLMVVQTLTQRFYANDKTLYLLVVSRDITERDVIIKDLKRSNQDLDNFAYVASHDLKAPLNVIKRLVSWVMEDCAEILPADSLEDLGLVMSRANRMEQLLHDLLAYSRMGKDYQQPKELNVRDKVVELLSLIDLPMGFVVECDNTAVKVPEVPFGVVLLNLISNAIKHHDSGNAKIKIKVRRNQSSNVITVMDNGPGIAPENRARIFDLFETLKPRDEVEGSGMGLSVVRRLVEHYGGHIKVEDHRPRGTKFIVYWPFKNLAEQVLTQLN